MAILTLPQSQQTLTQAETIIAFLAERGIHYQQWDTLLPLAVNATPKQVLDAYNHQLQPYMQQQGFQTADVVCITPETPNLTELRHKFLREHTHTEDEVRFFVHGWGDFWFHLDTPTDKVFCVRCQTSDLLAVPAGYKHWFDMGETPDVKVIRIFTDASGWAPLYTDSGIEQCYQPIATQVSC